MSSNHFSLLLALVVPSYAQAKMDPPKVGTLAARISVNDKSPPKDIYGSLLREYRRVTDCHAFLLDEIESIKKNDLNLVTNLSDTQLKSRYDRYNVKYLQYLAIEAKVFTQVKEVEKRLKETPLSDLKNRGDLEIKSVAINARYGEVRKSLCMLSVEANKDIQAALQSLPPEKRVVKNTGPEVKPKMPGIPNESRSERMKKSESEKIFLTPVDDEFYATQLGKKLEKDLSGRAEFWSYDYEKDDLYVKVGNEIGKLSVREDSPGIRYIRTRVGPSFVEPRGKDTQVDNLVSRGKFYSKDANEDSLFGPIAKDGPKFTQEKDLNKAKPGSGGGHDHKH